VIHQPQYSECNSAGFRGARGARAPHQRGAPTMFMCLAICRLRHVRAT